MARTESKMFPLGKLAPDFSLIEPASGKMRSFEELSSSTATVVMFICNHCPFVIHVAEELSKIGKEYGEKGVSFIAINSNDIENYPADSPDNMVKMVNEWGLTYPYLFDETQEIAKAYDAACTPDFYVFNGEKRCVYRGQLDGSRPGNDIPVTGEDLRAALDAVLEGREVPQDQKPSLGCGIKWK
ncbi:thioredoxin family protein [Mangrovibacillus cuniculi]|uniref:Thioredoxin family protein n=1 Tax=Mangrovibacillus cuniculi TaxID=2593652 RepID=A0A7S8HFH3_9BACI|nr:thioredoxin family protein [Mangrovibacillus cuniculi]QPC46521.1 thioredoxin family protein [Mangrovibacillus cuniculi]